MQPHMGLKNNGTRITSEKAGKSGEATGLEHDPQNASRIAKVPTKSARKRVNGHYPNAQFHIFTNYLIPLRQ
jgi:hypothetical protein